MSDTLNPGKIDLIKGIINFEANIKVTLDDVSRLCADFRLLTASHFSEEVSGLMDLGLTEVLTNIVRHGYEGPTDDRLIVTCHDCSTYWEIEVTDMGRAIPAGNMANADGSVFDFDPMNIDSIPEGGMGLSLIKALFDSLSYKSADGKNVMILGKKLS
jgi:serine/threonine-protein kinase RsbW